MTDFETKVAKMRKLQKDYFKRRDPLTLQACKKVEREVDDLIAGVSPTRKQEADAHQPNLFSSECHASSRYAVADQITNKLNLSKNGINT